MPKIRTFAEWVAAQESFACSSELDVYDDWLVVPVSRHRDSDCLEESNFVTALARLGGECEDTAVVCRFRHWAVGWTEIILAHPSKRPEVCAIADDLEGYPVLDELDLSEREQAEADRVWRECYSPTERVEYIREHRYQFEFQTFTDLLGCVRGRYFAGHASELL